MSTFKTLGEAVINVDHLLCLQPAQHPNKAILATFDTGQVVAIEHADPVTAIAQCIEVGTLPSTDSGTT